jgi:hypothetical protein
MGGKNAVSNVRVVDPSAGTDGVYIDRCISNLQNSHSQITILCQESYSLYTNTANTVDVYAGPQVTVTDEYQSLISQFETVRIRAFRFEIYDLNPAVPSNGWFSTFHDQFPLTAQPVYTAANVVDGPDVAIVPPGIGKVVLYWRARGTLENSFVTTDQASVSNPAIFYGGLRIFIPSFATAGTLKYNIVMKALVDFRGRL